MRTCQGLSCISLPGLPRLSLRLPDGTIPQPHELHQNLTQALEELHVLVGHFAQVDALHRAHKGREKCEICRTMWIKGVDDNIEEERKRSWRNVAG